MNITIREAVLDDIDKLTFMMQAAYADAYVNESIGLTSECFSLNVFKSKDTQDYLKTKLVNNDKQRSWVALDEDTIVGSVTIEDNGESCELSGFYVAPTYQGNGVGRLLWANALEFSKEKDITLDIYTHNVKTIELYKHWGFEEDVSRPRFFRHWPEWPEDVRAECMYMRRTAQ